MRGDGKWTVLSIILFIGLNLVFFAVSPIIDSSLRSQFEIMQLFLVVTIVASGLVGVFETAKRRL